MTANKWTFNEDGARDQHFQIHQHNNLYATTSFDDKCKPPGFIRGDFDGASGAGGGGKKDDRQSILMRQAWAQAKSPGKQIMMTGLMMWMSGSTMSIFTLMMMTMAMVQPITALFGTQKAFERFESPDTTSRSLWLPKLAFIAMNLICIGIGVWKLNALGLLPTGQHIPPTVAAPNYAEYSMGMIMN
eukprot:CAMPEP_0202711184 /NCGR_PEP_ID=MMETSP1385-20130828/23039_1 /ASSEMBLY_ACC=CAM_ASM_000861 /TAXON_ID=933848 /ORGANISM="Elphidium margaritaceum" /LENGTH=186 /DNA_ID=CAMNT_0049370867 /DNA_START=36 /DNA_END=596 /DNA_ORIENTATION=+